MPDKKKKILIVAPYGFNDRMANFLEFTSARLLAKNGWEVTGLTRRESDEPVIGILCGARVCRYRTLRHGIFLLLKILFTARPSVIHVHNLRNNRLGIIAALAAKLAQIPLIFTEYGLLHDHYLVTDREDPLGKPLRANGLVLTLTQIFTKSFISRSAPFFVNIKNYFFHWALTHAEKIVFVSEHNFSYAENLGLKNYIFLPCIFDDARWQMPEGANVPDFKQADETVKKIKTLRESPFCLFIGQLKLRKGWDIYLRAAALVDKKLMPRFALVTSSAKEPPEDFIRFTENLDIKDRIIFFGKIDGRALKELYESCSIVVVPSRYEGFGLVATEAYENNKPLIASAVAALTETVVDNYNGLLVSPKDPKKLADAITRLAKDKDLAKKLIDGGRETLARLKSDERKKEWLKFYEDIIA